MKNKKLLFVITVLLLLGLLGWWFWNSKPAEAKSLVKSPTHAVVTVKKHEPAPPLPQAADGEFSPVQARTAIFATLAKNPGSPIPAAQLMAAGVTKEQITKGVLDGENANPINYYGKVIDQHGDPIANVNVDGNILLNEGMESSRYDRHAATTDAKGLFQFTGLHGINIGISLKKDGYETSNKGYQAPNKEDKSNPDERAVFTMWKLKGAEPMVYAKFADWIPYDGTPVSISLSKGKKDATGDLKVTLMRSPVQIVRGRDHFDWNVRIEIVGGGLAETSDAYKYLAVESGYQPLFEFSVKKDDPHWTQKLVKDFYVHTNKDTYGRIHVNLTTDSDRPEGTGLSIEAYMNPAPGSRNLEFDRAKQIKP